MNSIMNLLVGTRTAGVEGGVPLPNDRCVRQIPKAKQHAAKCIRQSYRLDQNPYTTLYNIRTWPWLMCACYDVWYTYVFTL